MDRKVLSKSEVVCNIDNLARSSSDYYSDLCTDLEEYVDELIGASIVKNVPNADEEITVKVKHLGCERFNFYITKRFGAFVPEIELIVDNNRSFYSDMNKSYLTVKRTVSHNVIG